MARKKGGVTGHEGPLGKILASVPTLNYLELPYHYPMGVITFYQSALKSGGHAQEPCNNDMAYLLVCIQRETSEAESYSMALVWISPHQVSGIHYGGGIRDFVHLHCPVDLTGHMFLHSCI